MNIICAFLPKNIKVILQILKNIAKVSTIKQAVLKLFSCITRDV